jgi:hypothetical protein
MAGKAAISKAHRMILLSREGAALGNSREAGENAGARPA